jgi:MarR family transcriptional regulator, organic hydroperoxide resistance regulator
LAEKPSGTEYFDAWRLIRGISEIMVRIRDRELYQYGITIRQSALIYAVKALGDSATPSAIARLLLREPASASNLISRMEKDGYLERFQNEKRKNQVLVVLTKKGEEAFQNSTHRESVMRPLSKLSAKRFQQLQSIAEELRGYLMEELGTGMVFPPLPPIEDSPEK